MANCFHEADQSKYADRLPLYRQYQIYARRGLSVDRSKFAEAAFLLRPIHDRLFERLEASSKLFADETIAPVLDPGRGRTKTGQLFAYRRCHLRGLKVRPHE